MAVVDHDTKGGDAADLTPLAQPTGLSTSARVWEVAAEPRGHPARHRVRRTGLSLYRIFPLHFPEGIISSGREALG